LTWWPPGRLRNSRQTSPLLLPIGSSVTLAGGGIVLPLEGTSFTYVFELLQLYRPADASFFGCQPVASGGLTEKAAFGTNNVTHLHG
jgi:hypothetical protein